ncbi:hypothetical protein NDA13_000299 [Ustilago tritici]|nr:hypothetical protein NDA13_000299 [Ustilago tritici]
MLFFILACRVLFCMLVSALLHISSGFAIGSDDDIPFFNSLSFEPFHDEVWPIPFSTAHLSVAAAPDFHSPFQTPPMITHQTADVPGPSVVNNYASGEQRLTVVPKLGETDLHEWELWHIQRMLKYRLHQAKINPFTLRLLPPMHDVRHVHIDIIHKQLQLQVNSKQAVYLGPTVDHQGEIVAIPIHRDAVKEAVIDAEENGKVGWAIVGTKFGPHPAITWFSYALLDVPDRKAFVDNLKNSNNVKALENFFRPVASLPHFS